MAYVIVDLETDGLDPQGHILEISWNIVDRLRWARPETTQTRLIYVDEYQLRDIIRLSDSVVQAMHTESGLWAALANPDLPKHALSLVDHEIGQQLEQREGPHYLVGNSIRLDRAFIEASMPALSRALHYRQIDLTSSDLLMQSEGLPSTKQMLEGGHRTASDVEATILQLHKQLDILAAAREYGALRIASEEVRLDAAEAEVSVQQARRWLGMHDPRFHQAVQEELERLRAEQGK